MKRASTVIVVVAMMGELHCGDDVGGGALLAGAADFDEESDRQVGALGLEGKATRTGNAHFAGTARSSVTSTAPLDDGSRFVAGVFSDTIEVGDTVLRSLGGDDVFLARVRGDETVVWALGIGSKRTESGPRVSFDDGHVKLLAMTNGAVDCGRGPLRTWSSEMFFLCTFDFDGAPITGGSFPTGEP